MKRIISVMMVVLLGLGILVNAQETNHFTYHYGVFTKIEDKNILHAYETIVINIEEYEEDEIAALQQAGHVIYAYLDIGKEKEQEEISDSLPSYLEKGIDGFYVELGNCESQQKGTAAYKRIVELLTQLRKASRPVIVSNGIDFLKAFQEENGGVAAIAAGISETGVFTEYDAEQKGYVRADEGRKQRRLEELSLFEEECDIYLVEYTEYTHLISAISSFVFQKGWYCYIDKRGS